MASVSGLSKEHRVEARDRVVTAMMLGLKLKDFLHYTQGTQRWEGIARKLNAMVGQCPTHGDCSSFASWGQWVGLFIKFGVRDTVNGQRWLAGFTGTMLSHGKKVYHQENWLRADCIIYGDGGSGKHTATLVGKRPSDGKWMVVSFGSEAGPYYLPWDYRDDFMQCRRYI